MARGKISDQVQNAVGLYTSMNKPWDGADQDTPLRSDPSPDDGGNDPVRPVLSAISAALVLWLASVKSILPEGWF
jgi:hypothetical protein